ncbi:MAG: hypothetical protein ACI4EA_07390 [Candidatus Ornithomonoglobus sp.]
MQSKYIKPEIKVSLFGSENFVTASGDIDVYAHSMQDFSTALQTAVSVKKGGVSVEEIMQYHGN